MHRKRKEINMEKKIKTLIKNSGKKDKKVHKQIKDQIVIR